MDKTQILNAIAQLVVSFDISEEICAGLSNEEGNGDWYQGRATAFAQCSGDLVKLLKEAD